MPWLQGIFLCKEPVSIDYVTILALIDLFLELFIILIRTKKQNVMNHTTTILIISGILLIALVIRYYYVAPQSRYSNIQGYMQVWNTLSPSQKRKFKKTFYIDRLEYPQRIIVRIRQLRKQYTLLATQTNEVNSFYRKAEDGIKDIRYYTPLAALEVISDTSWYIPSSMKEYEEIKKFMPGSTSQQKMWNFIALFELMNYGEFNTAEKKWYLREEHTSRICLGVSKVDKLVCLFDYNVQNQMGYAHIQSGMYNSIALPILAAKKTSW